MRRLTQYVFNAFVGISLLLFFGNFALSFTSGIRIGGVDHNGGIRFHCGRDEFGVSWVSARPIVLGPDATNWATQWGPSKPICFLASETPEYAWPLSREPQYNLSLPGFDYERVPTIHVTNNRFATDGVIRRVSLGFSLIQLLTLVMPAVLALRFVRRRRRILRGEHGCCFNCGYDLRATPDRCPECGTIPGKLKV